MNIMKRILYSLMMLWIGSSFLVSCSNDENDRAEALSIADFYPAVVMEGTKLTVTGTAMSSVNEVVFPGGIASARIEHLDDFALEVMVPEGLSDEAVSLVVRADGAEAASRQTIRLGKPAFTMYQFTDNDGAKTNSNLTINGKDLLLVDEVIFEKDDDRVSVDALHLIRKSETAIKLKIPDNAPVAEGVQVFLRFKNGMQMALPEIDITVGDGSEAPTTDPITPQTIMLNDFEEHDGHNSSLDHSWTDSEATEFIFDEEKGNTYLHLAKPLDGWLINCNHQDCGTVSGIENYVIKFDLLIESGVEGASKAAMQYVLADKWLWIGEGFFPETTDGKWITVSRNISDISADLTGDLEIGAQTNGMYGGPIPAGICIDNLRLDPR